MISRRLVTAVVVLAAAAIGVVLAGSASSGSRLATMHLDTQPVGAVEAHHVQSVDGHQWSLTRFTNAEGQVCAGEKIPDGDAGQGLTCRDPNSLFANGPLVFFVGARQLPGELKQWDNAWVWGWASPAVVSLDLQLTDCRKVPLAIDQDRLFFQVLDMATLHSGVGPETLVAYDQTGAMLAQQNLPLSAPSSKQATAAGATAPIRHNCAP